MCLVHVSLWWGTQFSLDRKKNAILTAGNTINKCFMKLETNKKKSAAQKCITSLQFTPTVGFDHMMTWRHSSFEFTANYLKRMHANWRMHNSVAVHVILRFHADKNQRTRSNLLQSFTVRYMCCNWIPSDSVCELRAAQSDITECFLRSIKQKIYSLCDKYG